jgi:PKD repeat protein
VSSRLLTAATIMNFKNVSLFAFLLALISVQSYAQSESPCASETIYQDLIQNDQVFSRSMFYLNQRLSEMSHDNEFRASEEIYTVPTVVHIIHEGEGIGQSSNITDEQILSAIAALNEDFRKIAGSNGDGEGVDVGLEFCLASRDPYGNPSTGIVRVDGSTVANYADMGIEASGGVGANEATVKGLSTWPREEYMNIWVVNEIENNDAGGGIQGFAYFPFNNPLDGICVLYNAFGTVGNLKSNTDMGRTLTHEVGHFLGLYHTFHDTNDCDGESNCDSQGDRVCDTPATPLSSVCSAPACGIQQVENYMDYTSETCRNMFTDGQKSRMRATLLSDRQTIIDSFGCIPVTDYDAGIASIEFPGLSICSSAFEPEIILTNYGSETLTSVDVTYQIDNGPSQSYSWTGSLGQGLSENVNLPTISGATGIRNISITCASPNGVNDENSGNNSIDKTFEISSGEALQLEINIDYFGTETTWMVHDEEGAVVSTGGPYINNAQGTIYNESICVSGGCYELTMFDSYGDGMSFLTGSYALYDGAGDLVAEGTGNFGPEVTHSFCVDEVISNDPPSANFNSSSDTACSGGQLDFYDASANGPTTWAWTFEAGIPASSSNASPQNITYNSAGTYDVTLVVTNDGGSDTFTSSVTVASGPSVAMSSSSISCHDGNDGSITANVTGSGPYDYNWSSGGSSQTANGLSTGNYSVMVIDDNGCISQASLFMSNPNDMNLSLIVEDPLCFGSEDGSIQANASDGSGGYSYVWNNGDNDSNANDLAGGAYSVVVTDANGCTKTASASLDNPLDIQLTVSSEPTSCPGFGDGSVLANASGGAGGFTYAWSNGLSINEIEGLPAANYSIVVTDSNGCTRNSAIAIESPEEIEVQLFDFDIACGGSLGSANIDPIGGTGALTIAWSSGDSGMAIDQLEPGNYSVTITDANECAISESFEITSSDALSIQLTVDEITCNNASNGSILASANGGSGSYTYDWNQGSTEDEITNLTPGTYTVNVQDTEGCPGEASITIDQPDAISVVLFKTDISCHGIDDGAISSTINGGTTPYEYHWNNNSAEPNLVGLTQGNYALGVSDIYGCEKSASISVVEPSELVISLDLLANETCEGNDASAIVNIMGGTPDYQIFWTNGSIFQQNDELSAGNYSVTITDGNGCVVSETMNIVHDCETAAPTTMLSADYCGSMGLTLDNYISCDPIENAEMYQWKFENSSIGMWQEEISLGNNTTFYLSEVSSIVYGITINVSLKTLVDGTWSTYGEVCQITMAEDIPITQLVSSDCGMEGATPGTIIMCDPIAGAYAYEWKFSANDFENTFTTYMNSISLISDMMMSDLTEYNVAVRTQIGDNWSEWGSVCTVSIDFGTFVEEGNNEGTNLQIFPNPNNGEKISIEISNPGQGVDVIVLELFNASGQLVDTIAIPTDSSGYLKTTYTFENKLSAGMYFIKYWLNDRALEKKIIVR